MSEVNASLKRAMTELLKKKPQTETMERLPYSNIYKNSVNIFCGKQNSGKTFSCLQELIKISRFSEESHLLVYINKTGERSDATFECIKDLIQIPIVYLSHDAAEDYLKKMIEYKHLYNEVIKHGLVEELPKDVREEMLTGLNIKDFGKPYLHTLVLLDDTAQSSLISRDNSYMNQLLTQCRHIQCSFFMCVQYWKSINANTKSNVSTVYLFSGYSKQQLNYIFYQLSLSIPIEEVYEMYTSLGSHEALVLDTLSNNVSVN